jgi:hypothetical protein
MKTDDMDKKAHGKDRKRNKADFINTSQGEAENAAFLRVDILE